MDNKDLKSILLADRTDRTGVAPGTLRGIRLYSNSKPVDVALTGSPLEIEVDYFSDRGGTLNFFIAFYDVFERRVIHINTIMSGLSGKIGAGTGTVKCTIPKLPLAPGTYHLAVAVDCAGVTLDRVEHAYELSVSMGDFYNTGRTVGSDWGMFLLENHWEVK
jgi:lipopolysaccharide transport system ATP-binding protein